MNRLVITLGVVLSLGFLGCSGYKNANTAQQEEVKEKATTVQQEEATRSGQESVQTIQVTQTTLNVDGMTCGGCTTGVRQCLVKLDGVTEAKVSYEDGKAVVSYNPEKVTKEKMVEEINKIGFKASMQ